MRICNGKPWTDSCQDMASNLTQPSDSSINHRCTPSGAARRLAQGFPRAMKREERGFGLLESVIVILLLLLLAVLTVPSLSGALNAWQLNSDARNIASALLSAKIKATSQANRYQVLFGFSQNNWTLQRLNKTTGSYEVDESAVVLSNGLQHSGIQLNAGSSSAPAGFPTASSAFIRFNSRGIPIDGTGVPSSNNVIYLGNSQKDYAVSVSLAGRIELWRKDGSQWVLEK